MSTVTMPPPVVREDSTMFFSGYQIAKELSPKFNYKKNDAGASVLVVQDVAVFRSGTFADSMGLVATWEPIHIDQLVAHFEMLKNRNIFADVPVRDGHPGFLVSGQEGNGKVVGYHTSLRAEERISLHDGNPYTYLIAEYEILDPEAQEKISSGLWRSLSAEVGRYVTNDGAEFWPVYWGVAYVDIPAVEGLKGFSNGTRYIIEEESVSNAKTVNKPELPAPPTDPPTGGELPTGGTGVVRSGERSPFVFSIGGNETSDFAAVQSYVAALESEVEGLRQFRAETVEAGRNLFVESLASSGKLLASRLQDAKRFAQMLSDEQFAAWKAIMEAAPANPILGNYDSSGGSEPTPTGAVDAAAERAATLRGIIKQHQRAGLSADKIKMTNSYKELAALDPTFTL